jgi:pimeloyl-ACP methyl ester carboxylesterase
MNFQYTDNFLDVRRDIEAAVYTARALGYRTVVLYGQSLGNIQVQYYAANNWDADIKAVVLSGMFANLPWRTRHVLVQNEDNFRLLSEAAFKMLREGKQDNKLPMPMRTFTGENVPLTGQNFLTYRSEASSTADGTYWIKRIPRPILMVRDAGDAIIEPFEPYMLLSAATSAGSLVPSIKYVLLPNAKGMSSAAHSFTDNKVPLIGPSQRGWAAALCRGSQSSSASRGPACGSQSRAAGVGTVCGGPQRSGRSRRLSTRRAELGPRATPAEAVFRS